MLTRIYFGVFDGMRIVQRGSNGSNVAIMKDVHCITTNESYEQVAVPLNTVIGNALPHIQRGDNIVMRLARQDNVSPPVVESFYILPYWYKSVPLDQWDKVLNELQKRERQP